MLDKASPPQTEASAHRQHIIKFVAKLLSCFVLPFITLSMSLTDQVKSLSTFGHLAVFLYIKHGTACLTGALYSDAQAVVKNIIFTIARLQLIDPEIPFYIIHEGTDRLEGLFDDCRTQDHARNFDIAQLSEKLGVATLINAAYQRNPELDCGHRRLSLKGALGIDQVNPRSWEGDTRVGNVDLRTAWDDGCQSANSILVEFFVDAAYNFANAFSQPNTDLLRPSGGAYVGSKATADDSRSEDENPVASKDGNSDTVAFQADIDTVTAGTGWPVETPSNDKLPNPTTGVVLPEDEDFQDISDGLDIDNYFPETLDEGKGDTPLSQTIEVEGQKILLDPLVATLSPKHWKRVTMRTFWSQGRVIEDFQKSNLKFEDFFDADDTDDDTVMKSTDLGAFLAYSDEKICLAIMEVTGFHFNKGKTKVFRTTAKYDDLAVQTSKITVVGQLIEIQQSDSQPALWEWPKRYIKLDIETKSDLLTRQHFSLEIPSNLFHPLSQRIIRHKELRPEEKLRWTVTTDELEKVLEYAWEILDPEGDNITSHLNMLLKIKNPDSLPYRSNAGMLSIRSVKRS